MVNKGKTLINWKVERKIVLCSKIKIINQFSTEKTFDQEQKVREIPGILYITYL